MLLLELNITMQNRVICGDSVYAATTGAEPSQCRIESFCGDSVYLLLLELNITMQNRVICGDSVYAATGAEPHNAE